MPDKYTYLLVDVCCILFPFLFSFHPRIRFYRQWRHFLVPCIATASFFILWDVVFTRAGVWGFNPRYVTGLFFFDLPLEEYLFFLCIPYACVFTYYVITRYYSFAKYAAAAEIFAVCLAIVLATVGLLHSAQLYTSVTFLLLAATLGLLVLRKVIFLAGFFAAFFAILLPFFVSNGILTGTGPDEPVVIYNDLYNLRLRMLTIPVEDTFYGMLLLLMNVAGMEYLKKRSSMVHL